jgi:uncharacterized membrane protein
MQTLILKNSLPNGFNRFFTSRISIRIILFIIAALWCLGFLSGALLPDSVYAIIASPFLKKIYGAVCHQHIEKTFLINGHYFLVCARCTGIYLGALFISFISIFILRKLPNRMNLLYISTFPMLIDVALTTTGIYHYSKIIALFTGLFFGSAVFAYILGSIENNFLDKSL